MEEQEQDPYQDLALDGLTESELQEHLAELNRALLGAGLDPDELGRLAARREAISARIQDLQRRPFRKPAGWGSEFDFGVS